MRGDLDELVEAVNAEGRCPDCGTMGYLWHKLGCPRDERPPPPSPPAGEAEDTTGPETLFRLAAVSQYLYDTMNGDHLSKHHDSRKDPLPPLAMESVREAQRLLLQAVKDGQREHRVFVGGQIKLSESPPKDIGEA